MRQTSSDGESGRGLVLVVDDDREVCELVGAWLRRAGHEVEVLGDGEACLRALGRSLPDCVCLDLNLPGMSGLDALTRIKAHHPKLPVIMLTAETEVATVVAAMQAGAYDYLAKPLDQPKLIATVGHAVENRRLSLRVAQLEREVDGRGYADILGASPAMRRLFADMDRVAASDVTVLIHGESGTGKELVARALHAGSGRSGGRFAAVNCAAVPETLEASEFFGHEKGAFTGATQRRSGRFEEADGGTLFLDEIGELGLGLQAKLLRVLQERRFRRLGGQSDIGSDFRLLAATHRDLESEVRAGRFREDLFFRVVVFELDVPPLRERGDDLRLLAEHFLAGDASGGSERDARGTPPRLADETLDALAAHTWPGNVRELQNALEHARVVCRGGIVRPHDLPGRIVGKRRPVRPMARPPAPDSASSDRPSARPSDETSEGPSREGATEPATDAPAKTLAQLEREAIEAAVARTGGNLSEVVRQLGIGRTTLYRKLKQYGLRS